VNLNVYEVDILQQYSRRENIRIHGVDEEAELLDIATALDIKLYDEDI